ncbi:TPA: hypothetical protein N0F65_003124 [Lagenidium giganteum]|uniref:Uncharacterized protein n=1 Tax=Lagenidium giganteum TaxID=4803 RepID=A0AAV2YY71_9STRA|nr:TPA: hypothetical protein N0F65_003124 [Lagenidium giganteum]
MRITVLFSCVLLGLIVDGTSALVGKNAERACAAVTTCYKGGNMGQPCAIGREDCPPCTTFDNNGCFEIVNGKCPFGTDCTNVFSGGKPTEGSSSAAFPSPTPSSPSPSPSSRDQTGPGEEDNGKRISKAPTASATPTTSAQSLNDSNNADSTTGNATKSGNGMTLVFGIIGAAIGVIAVAVIFLALVRRSRTSEDDEEIEVSNTPHTFNKAPNRGDVGGGATYAQYATDSSQVSTSGVINYYNQAPAAQPVMARPALTAHRAGRPGSRNNSVESMHGSQLRNDPTYHHTVAMGEPAASDVTNTHVAVSVHPPEHPSGVIRRASSPRGTRNSFEF